MGTYSGPRRTSNSVVPILLHYDMHNPKSYAGEPTTNLVDNGNLNSINNAVEGNVAPGWDTSNHAKAITLNDGWASGYNGGVANPTTGFHAHQIYGGCDADGAQLSGRSFNAADNDGACFHYVDRNDLYSEGHRWLGISQSLGTPTSLGLAVSDDITLSWWQRSDVTGQGGQCGIYHMRVTEGTNGFESCIQTINVTEANTWERVSFTYTITSNWNVGSNCWWYAYGYNGAHGILQIDNIQLEEKSHATRFTNSSRSTTTSLLDPIAGTTITANSLTYGAHPAFEFNGSSDYITTSTIPSFTAADEFSIEMVIKPDSTTTDMRFITPTGLGIDRWIGTTTGGKLTLQLCQAADTGGRGFNSTASVSTTEYQHWVVTVNGTDINFYLNGALDSNHTDSSGFSVGQWGGYTWYIGQRSNSTFWYDGEIPSVTVYDGVLTAAQVAANFGAARGVYGI